MRKNLSKENKIIIGIIVFVIFFLATFSIYMNLFYLVSENLSIDKFRCEEFPNQTELLGKLNTNDNNYQRLVSFVSEKNLTMSVQFVGGRCPSKAYLQVEYNDNEERQKLIGFLSFQKLFGIPVEVKKVEK